MWALCERIGHERSPETAVLIMGAMLVAHVSTSVLARPVPRASTLVPRWTIDLLKRAIDSTEPDLIRQLKEITGVEG
jgi:hypothetical protein